MYAIVTRYQKSGRSTVIRHIFVSPENLPFPTYSKAKTYLNKLMKEWNDHHTEAELSGLEANVVKIISIGEDEE